MNCPSKSSHLICNSSVALTDQGLASAPAHAYTLLIDYAICTQRIVFLSLHSFIGRLIWYVQGAQFSRYFLFVVAIEGFGSVNDVLLEEEKCRSSD